MITGLGFSEVILILVLVLLFFGSKEIPQFIRTVARFLAKVRFYTEKVRREIDSVTHVAEIAPVNQAAEKKKEFRTIFLSKRKGLSEEERIQKSRAIYDHLAASSYMQNAATVMIYANIGSEVKTDFMIQDLLKSGKRVILPYCNNGAADMGIAEVHDFENDLEVSSGKIPEVKPSLRKPFFKSDLQLILCPGVAFDTMGARLGRGKSFYDRFLKELRGQVPIVGLAYDCQISCECIPFEYHDVKMDQVITESGLLLKRDSDTASAPPVTNKNSIDQIS